MVKHVFFRWTVTPVLAACLSFAALASSAAPPEARPPQGGMAGQTGMGSAEMMKMHEKMMAEMSAADARLDALVKTMNASTGDDRTTAIVAVINEMVAQHKAMHAHMHEMHQHMMGGQKMGGQKMMGGRQ